MGKRSPGHRRDEYSGNYRFHGSARHDTQTQTDLEPSVPTPKTLCRKRTSRRNCSDGADWLGAPPDRANPVTFRLAKLLCCVQRANDHAPQGDIHFNGHPHGASPGSSDGIPRFPSRQKPRRPMWGNCGSHMRRRVSCGSASALPAASACPCGTMRSR